MSIQLTRRSFLLNAAGLAVLTGTACAAPQQSDSTESTTAEQSSTSTATSQSDSAQSSTSDKKDVTVLESFDMHCDTIDVLGMVAHQPYASHSSKNTGTLSSNDAMVSADRIGNAHWVQFYTIWIPPTQGDESTEIKPIEWYREAAAWFKNQMDVCKDRFTQVRDFSQISSILEEGKIPAVLAVENASCLEEGVGIVDEFAKDGVMVASLTWNGKNALGAGINYPDVGLTDLGKDCIAALEEHNITLDVSHLNDTCFWDYDALASKPYIATHSNARAVCNVARNLTDDQFRTIAQRGGIVGLNFHSPFVHSDGGDYDFDALAKHVEHWLDLDGENALALGSDRDGAVIPSWLADCSQQDALYHQFVDRFGETIAHELFFDNAMRFFGAL